MMRVLEEDERPPCRRQRPQNPSREEIARRHASPSSSPPTSPDSGRRRRRNCNKRHRHPFWNLIMMTVMASLLIVVAHLRVVSVVVSDKTKNNSGLAAPVVAYVPPSPLRRRQRRHGHPSTWGTSSSTSFAESLVSSSSVSSSRRKAIQQQTCSTTVLHQSSSTFSSSSSSSSSINGSSPPPPKTKPSSPSPSSSVPDQDQHGGYLLSPYHLLYPEFFPADQATTATLSSSYNQTRALSEHSVSMLEALRLMKQALEAWLQHQEDEEQDEAAFQKQKEDDNDDNQSTTKQSPLVLRIEQKVSHSVDPLCWLQAQILDHHGPISVSSSTTIRPHPTFYFATAEGTLETAVFGSAWTHTDSLQDHHAGANHNDHGYHEKQEQQQHQQQQQQQFDDPWQSVIPYLPDRARLYGGQRFDTNQGVPPSEEWQAFGRALWILPAVEVRRETTATTMSASSSSSSYSTTSTTTTLAIHLVAENLMNNERGSRGNGRGGRFGSSARHVLSVLKELTDQAMPATPPTTLPPVLSRSTNYQRTTNNMPGASIINGDNPSSSMTLDGQEVYERGVSAALQEFQKRSEQRNASPCLNSTNGDDSVNSVSGSGNQTASRTLSKVVLARRLDLNFAQQGYASVRALDILRKWKFASQPGGHLFYLCPDINVRNANEFFGCTPERLFQVQTVTQESLGEGCTSTVVVSEALAGTRPRGSTLEADQELSRQLFASTKDQEENFITGRFILEAFEEMERRGWVRSNNLGVPEDAAIQTEFDLSTTSPSSSGGTVQGRYFVRRLRHLQHICQQFQCHLSSSSYSKDVMRYLVDALHPTPAVNGYPKETAMEFIRQHERIGFDRGFYAGPLGFVSRTDAEIVVAIRSGLVSRGVGSKGPEDDGGGASALHHPSKVSVYAGAGIVPGSTVQGEWAETSYKLAVVSSIFPQSPITLQSEKTPNAAWATAFVEELIRNGVTQFYICPGSRSTPLVVAIAKAVRSYVGIVHALSIHDERGAGFRAVGYGRGFGRPAAVITSSGTAIANLYPAIVEAGMDAVPLLVITADRPYESRDTGANQAIDQVKAFSQTYIRWFRDILPPNDDVPISVALADAAHGVSLSKQLKGPVHLNIQFRENLAPDGGPIRNDDRQGSATKFDNVRFTDAAGFQRWSLGGASWITRSSSHANADWGAVNDIARLILESKRGLVVVGNIRKPSVDNENEDASQVNQMISDFAQTVGFPILASTQSGDLRFSSPAVVPFAEHLLKNPLVQDNLKPDLVLQLGAPLISTEIPKMIKLTMRHHQVDHVVVHPHHPHERADPEFTTSHSITAEIGSFVRQLMKALEMQRGRLSGSQLAPMVLLGRLLQREMPEIVNEAVKHRKEQSGLTEPEVMLGLSKTLTSGAIPRVSLFLSNSMPVRDAEAFLYPLSSELDEGSLVETGVNRGASGIDGVIAAAAGFADSTDRPTTLLIGDVAALHDINSLHSLRTAMSAKESQAQKIHPLTTIVLNNNGGGIFSFLPVAKYGKDVAFDEFFGTPTSSFSFEKGAGAFDIPFKKVDNISSLADAYIEAVKGEEPCIIEAMVATREENVAIHQDITLQVNKFILSTLTDDAFQDADVEVLPLKMSSTGTATHEAKESGSKTIVLLHGWMGDKEEWTEVEANLIESLSPGWSILSVDLPGHGSSILRQSNDLRSIRNALGQDEQEDSAKQAEVSLDGIARIVFRTLKSSGIKSVDALAGYSLGGRVALAMKRLSMTVPNVPGDDFDLINDRTKMILLSSHPGNVRTRNWPESEKYNASDDRLAMDNALASEMVFLTARCILSKTNADAAPIVWSDFLRRWYSAPLWGSLSKQADLYPQMIEKRTKSLALRGADYASILQQCSPPRCRNEDWREVKAEETLFLVGSLDQKYCAMGREWSDLDPSLGYIEFPGKGHALLVEDPGAVANAMTEFLQQQAAKGSLETTGRDTKIWNSTFIPSPKKTSIISAVQPVNPQYISSIASLDFEAFSIDLVDKQGIYGIGWGGKAKATASESVMKRDGVILQIMSSDGLLVGLGEVSPLSGLHPETLPEAEAQLEDLAGRLSKTDPDLLPSFDAKKVLGLDGALNDYLLSFLRVLEFFDPIFASVQSGLEMSILSLASQVVRLPIHEALSSNSLNHVASSGRLASLALNGLIRRDSDLDSTGILDFTGRNIIYSSWKIKIGHRPVAADVRALEMTFLSQTASTARIRADANRGFNETTIRTFGEALHSLGDFIVERLEYVEEPIYRQQRDDGTWTLDEQVLALERTTNVTSLPYALDESIFDLLQLHSGDFDRISRDLREVFAYGPRGCAALILKPSLLGLEMSMRLARLARSELGLGAVFTSSFDSGIGLAHASFLASLSDATNSKPGTLLYSHGLSTFEIMPFDCLSPSFGSYVNKRGVLNVASISRALYGLGMDEIQSLSSSADPPQLLPEESPIRLSDGRGSSPPISTASLFGNLGSNATVGNFEMESSDFMADEFVASTSSSSNGRDIVVVASLPLPFSADIASARFTDLPQQPRWSPWLASVAYLDAPGSETEWTLRVRGVSFQWRAHSEILQTPHKGISWKSTSGVKNAGYVEFIPSSENPGKCYMKLRMAFVTPRLMSSLFRGTVLEDFLRNKILKWSLEMFRDVVKGDLALEEGNVELGDALFGAVEGKASAIEEALLSSSPKNHDF